MIRSLPDDYMKLKAEYDSIQYYDTGVEVIQKTFSDRIVCGSVYLFVAATGVGKTTLLLSTAKADSRAHPNRKILFITTEQALCMLIPYFDEYDNIKFGTSINDFVDDEITHYDAIYYDYIASEVQDGMDDWSGILSIATKIANYAKDTRTPIFTAAQATYDIATADNDELRSTKFVAYSKGIVNKVAGAAYLLKDGNAITFKNRYGIIPVNRIHYDLNYELKTFLI